MSTRLRTLVAVVGVVMLGQPTRAAAQVVKVSIDTTECVVGRTAVVPVRLAGAAAVGALQFEVVYDPSVLEVSAVQRGPLLDGMDYSTLESNAGLTPGRLKIALINQFPLADDGVLFEIQGRGLGAAGQRSPLTIEKAAATRNEVAMGDIPLQAADGELRIIADPSAVAPPPAMAVPPPPPAEVASPPSPSPVAPVNSPPPVAPAGGGGGPVLPRWSVSGTVVGAAIVLVLGALALGAGVLVLRSRRGGAGRTGVGKPLQLAVLHPDGTTQLVSMTSRRLAVGRRDDNDLRLLDPQVSGVHAEILAGPEGIAIRDLGSTGGTSVNGQPIVVSPLQIGDEIVVGATRILLRG